MRIGYFADGPWSHRALEKIVQSELMEIAFIIPRYDTQDPVLKEWADELGVPYYPVKNVNTEEFIDWMERYKPDLLVSMSFNQILKADILASVKEGFINCHAGALPFYRGRNPLNWALINGENSFGITVHYVDEGIDTGDIVVQKHYPITMEDTYASLLKLAIYECAEVLFLALKQIALGTVKRIKQEEIHPVGTYFGIRTFGDEVVNFKWPAIRFFNFVRAISNPGPGARFWVNEQEYAIEVAKLIVDAPIYIATEGEVVGRDNLGVIVKVGDSTIRITRVRKVDSSGETEVLVPIFKIGTRLKSEPQNG